MKRIHKILNRPISDHWLFLKSMLLLTAFTGGLRIIPFHWIQRILRHFTKGPRKTPAPERTSAELIAKKVQTASQYVPAAVCLPQALAAQFLLKRSGYSSEFHIGVAKNESGQFEAHAWVTLQDQIIIGNLPGLSRFTPLPSLESDYS